MEPALKLPTNDAPTAWWSIAALITAAMVVASAAFAVVTAGPGDLGVDRFVAWGSELRSVPMGLALFALLVEPRTGRRWAMLAMAGWVIALVLFAIATLRIIP